MVHGALLYTGKVLSWGVLLGGPNPPPPWTPAKLYDPLTDTITEMSTPFNVDVVCAGQSTLPNGKLMFTGGAIIPVNYNGAGINNTTFFDPATNTWSQGNRMNYPRWYPTNLELGNGDTLVTSGHDQTGIVSVRQMETYNQDTGVWTLLPSSADNQDPGNLLYPRLELLPNGKVFKSAPRKMAQLFDPATNTWTNEGNMNFGFRYYTGHVLLPNSYTELVVGGTPSNAGGGTTSTNTTETIDLSAANPTWQYGASLNKARFNENLMYLSDGSLIAIGGNAGPACGLLGSDDRS